MPVQRGLGRGRCGVACSNSDGHGVWCPLAACCGVRARRSTGLSVEEVCLVLTRPGPVELTKTDKIAAWGVLPEDCLISFILEA